MKFSTKIRYGIRTMISIAMRHEETGGVFQKDIASEQNISIKYLDHIISALKISRLIRNASGRKSGYILTRKPEEITLYDIHNAFEPGLSVIDCLENNASSCQKSSKCASQYFWCQLNNLIVKQFESYTLADLVEKQRLLNVPVNQEANSNSINC